MEQCNKVNHRIECYKCGYPGCEARYFDATPLLPCNVSDEDAIKYINNCNSARVPE